MANERTSPARDSSDSQDWRISAGSSLAALAFPVTYLARLLRVELAAQISLASCALLSGTVLVGVSVVADSSFEGGVNAAVSVLGGAVLLSFVVYLYCVGPVALLIAPLYAALEARNRATATTSVCAGLVPGLLALIYSATPFPIGVSYLLPLSCLAAGAAIAAGIHLIRTWKQLAPDQ